VARDRILSVEIGRDPGLVEGPTTGGIGALQGAALTLGALLGTGVISLPALAAEAAGPASLVAWGLLIVVSVAFAASFTALGSRFPDGGGVTTYVRRAFGDRASTAVGWSFYLTIPIGAPVAAGFAAHYVADALDRGRGTALLVTAMVLVAVTLVNWFGIEASARTQLVIAGVLAVVLVVVIVLSLPHARAGNLTPFAPHGVGGIGRAAAMLVWAFVGWEIMASLSGRYHTPGRDIARAAAGALGVVTVLYVGIAFCTVAVLGSSPGRAPLSDLLVIGVGEAARPAMTVVALLLTIATINTYFAGAAEMGASLARDGSLPAYLAVRAGPGAVPRRSLAVVALTGLATTGLLAVLGRDTDATLLLTTATFALVYLAGTAAAVVLLDGWGRVAGVLAVLASAGLVAATGWRVLVPLAVGCLGVVWARRRGRVMPAT
jgi:amino acid efflux transporter